MNNPRLFVFLLLGAYIFSPSLLTWILDPEGRWYRPYILWAGLILGTFLLQKYSQRSRP